MQRQTWLRFLVGEDASGCVWRGMHPETGRRAITVIDGWGRNLDSVVATGMEKHRYLSERSRHVDPGSKE